MITDDKTNDDSRLPIWLFLLSLAVVGCPVEDDEDTMTGEEDETIKDSIGADVGDDCSLASLISANGTVGSELDGIDDFDFFEVSLSYGGTLRAYTTGNTDTLGAVLDESCIPLVTNDDSSTDINFDISMTVVEAGTYFIAVGGASESENGEYTLHVTFVGAENQNAPTNCWLYVLGVYTDWVYQSPNDPSQPPSYGTWDTIPAIDVLPPGVWNGNTFYSASEEGDLQFTISADRTYIESFSGTDRSTNLPLSISGSGVPVTVDSALLTTLEAKAEGSVACDFIGQFEMERGEGWEMVDFYCDDNGLLRIYCD